jgi:hypothetical protein
MEPVFRLFFEWCERVKLPVTIAAGNSPETFLDESVPQKFGTEMNTLITVGGVDQDGRLYHATTPSRPGHPGHMTVFAPAVDIIVPGRPATGDTGTSQAAAIVVSTIASCLIDEKLISSGWSRRLLLFRRWPWTGDTPSDAGG